jgi:hypothetical protein
MVPSLAEIFYTPPGGSIGIHVDRVRGQDNPAKLNWAYGGAGSTMRWYSQTDNTEPKIMTTPIGTGYALFDRQSCTLVHETEIGQPTLVNAGIPHDVTNPDSHGRWCVSITLADLVTRSCISFEQAAQRFHDCMA